MAPNSDNPSPGASSPAVLCNATAASWRFSPPSASSSRGDRQRHPGRPGEIWGFRVAVAGNSAATALIVPSAGTAPLGSWPRPTQQNAAWINGLIELRHSLLRRGNGFWPRVQLAREGILSSAPSCPAPAAFLLGIAESSLGIVFSEQVLDCQRDQVRIIHLQPQAQQGDLLECLAVQIAAEMH